MEPVQTRLGDHVVLHFRLELRPALVGRARRLTGSLILRFLWRRVQNRRNCWKRGIETVLERRMCRTRWLRSLRIAANRFGGWLTLEGQCFARIQERRGQNTSGPSRCSYLQHTSSADCAFIYLFDFRPVVCLLCRHRISFQPFGCGLKSKRSFAVKL